MRRIELAERRGNRLLASGAFVAALLVSAQGRAQDSLSSTPWSPPTAPLAATAPATDGMLPLRLKVNLGGGVAYFEEPFHNMQALRAAEQLGVSWQPKGIPGELGANMMMDEAHVTAFRLEMRWYFQKGPVFSQYHSLSLDLVPSKAAVGGGGTQFGFEWLVHRRIALVWAFGFDGLVYLPGAAPPIPIPSTVKSVPTAYGYIVGSSTLSVQARF